MNATTINLYQLQGLNIGEQSPFITTAASLMLHAQLVLPLLHVLRCLRAPVFALQLFDRLFSQLQYTHQDLTRDKRTPTFRVLGDSSRSRLL
jgi:hypothetical protein